MAMSGDEHFRKLERLYLVAPTNRYYRPSIHISEGQAEVEVPVRPKLFHAAQAVHGSTYFKVLDDAAYFAVNSLVRDVLVLTVSFSLYLTRPVKEGVIRAQGRVVHASPRLYVAEARAVDSRGKTIATGSGSFMKSSISLSPKVGYE